MSEREAFGPNLRRIRLQRGVSLQQLAETTKVSESLWAGLERNDFSRWPTGIYARSFVREYATAIGLDPETTVDDFCRWFPQGDRRVEETFREFSAIIAHPSTYQDEFEHAAEGDRRRPSPQVDAIARPPTWRDHVLRVARTVRNLRPTRTPRTAN